LAWVRVNDFVLAGAVVHDHRLDCLAQWEVELGIVGPLLTVADAHAFLESEAADLARAQLTSTLAGKRLAARARWLSEASFRHLLIAALRQASQADMVASGTAAALLDTLKANEIVASLRAFFAGTLSTIQQRAELEDVVYGLAADPRISTEPLVAKWAFSLRQQAWWPALAPAVARLMANAGGDINLSQALVELKADLQTAFGACPKEPVADAYPQVWEHGKALYDLYEFSELMRQKYLSASMDQELTQLSTAETDFALATCWQLGSSKAQVKEDPVLQ
jgi:hypothetical protein